MLGRASLRARVSASARARDEAVQADVPVWVRTRYGAAPLRGGARDAARRAHTRNASRIASSLRKIAASAPPSVIRTRVVQKNFVTASLL